MIPETSVTAETVADRYADYVIGLRYSAIPPGVIDRARHCLVDALGCAIFGRELPWSKMILAEVLETGSSGPCEIPGTGGVSLPPSQASFVLGCFAHGFEFDSLRRPSAGVHPGATVALPAFAVAQATGAPDEEMLLAIVAACDVMFRIGLAMRHTPEQAGFHAPGLTGPFGSAIAAGRLMGLSRRQLANALGIAGSLTGGLLAFARAGEGGMVKRLHLGRAAEAGVLAAGLAARGFEAPRGVIEGEFGLLGAFCSNSDPSKLLTELGERFEIESLCLKRFPCHITAHAPVELLRSWMEEHNFSGEDVATVKIGGSAKLVSHHSDPAPQDLMLAQYSVPFVIALAAFLDPEDPANYSTAALHDPRVRDLARKVTIGESELVGGWDVEMEVVLLDGRRMKELKTSFKGAPETPFTSADLKRKYSKICRDAPGADALLNRFLAEDRIVGT